MAAVAGSVFAYLSSCWRLTTRPRLLTNAESSLISTGVISTSCPPAPQFAAGEIDFDVAEAIDVRLGSAVCAAQDRLNARAQLQRAEWLGHVVVRPKLQAEHLLGFLGLCRQWDDRVRTPARRGIPGSRPSAGA